MVADSSSSFGIDRKYCRNKNTLYGYAKHAGMIIGNKESSHPIFPNMIYCGMISAIFGIIIVAIMIEKITFFPLKSIRARGYATNEEEINVPAVVPSINNTVLRTYKSKFECRKIYA